MRIADFAAQVETVRDLRTLQAFAKPLLNSCAPARRDQCVRSNQLVLATRHRKSCVLELSAMFFAKTDAAERAGDVNTTTNLVVVGVARDQIDEHLSLMLVDVRHHAPKVRADGLRVRIDQIRICEEDVHCAGRLVGFQRTEPEPDPAQLLLSDTAGNEVHRFVDADPVAGACGVVDFGVDHMVQGLISGEDLAPFRILSEADLGQMVTDKFYERVGTRLAVHDYPDVVDPSTECCVVE